MLIRQYQFFSQMALVVAINSFKKPAYTEMFDEARQFILDCYGMENCPHYALPAEPPSPA